MDISTIFGLALGGFFMIISMIGNLASFWNLDGIYITVGGTIAATMINFPFGDIKRIPAILRVAFTKTDDNPFRTIELLVGFAEVSRREGLLALEEKAQQVDDEFLQRGIQLVVDGTDPDLVRSIMEIELNYVEERHSRGQEIFDQMGSYAPSYGMIGTLIGLIVMLQEFDDASALGAGMAVALVTTFYGSLLANWVFLPIAGKLKVKSQDEILRKEIMLEGILSIRAGENPRIVEEKLIAFVQRSLVPENMSEGSVAGGLSTDA